MSKSQSVAPAGSPTHTPKIRIKGVTTGSPEYNAIVDKYRGALGQFYRSQQQQVRTSGQRVYKASRHVPGAQMTYQNNAGQETITLVVETEGGVEERSEQRDEYWRWAIIETTVPNIQGLTSTVMSAFMVPPPSNGKFGVAIDKSLPFDEVRPPLSYAVGSLETFIEDVEDNDVTSSLRVDLQQYPGGVKFDLYGYIRRYQDGTTKGTATVANRTMYRGANSVSPGSASYTTLGGTVVPSWYDASAISGRTQTDYIYKATGTPRTTLADIAISFPALPGPFTTGSIPGPFGAAWTGDGPAYGGESIHWTPGFGGCPDASTMNLSAIISAAGGLFTETTTVMSDGVSKMVRGIGAQTYTTSGGVDTLLNGAGPSDADGNWSIEFFDYTIYYVGDHPDVPVYVYPERDCPVSFVVLDVGPDANSNHFGSPLKDNHYRWESTRTYPARWKMKQIGVVHMTAIDDSSFPTGTIANHFSMIKLGTVMIHPRKGKGGIKFVAA